ncbi:MAG TPA: BCCT family transporter, partial [Kiloniellales bacterium]|nr:BCCT family transporter [Kiloniellales bacterium]
MAEESQPAPEGPTEVIPTDYEVGQDNIQPALGPLGLDIHNPVFVISGLTIIIFVAVTLALPGL